MWDKTVDNLRGIGDFIEDAADTAGSMGIWGIFVLLGALILAALAAAAAMIDAVLGGITTLRSATIRYAACLIYEQISYAFETLRLACAAACGRDRRGGRAEHDRQRHGEVQRGNERPRLSDAGAPR